MKLQSVLKGSKLFVRLCGFVSLGASCQSAPSILIEEPDARRALLQKSSDQLPRILAHIQQAEFAVEYECPSEPTRSGSVWETPE